MDYSLVVFGLVGVVVFIVVIFFVLGKVTDFILTFFLARKARKALYNKGYQDTVGAIDDKLEALEEDIRRSKAQAAKLARWDSLSGPYEGIYQEIRWLRRFREAVENENRINPRTKS